MWRKHKDKIFKPSMTLETKTVSPSYLTVRANSFAKVRTNQNHDSTLPSLIQSGPYWSMSQPDKEKTRNYIISHKYQPQPATTNHYNEQAYEYLVLACFVETPDLR